MGRFFQNKVGFQCNRLARATINQILIKKAKFFIFHKLERFVLKSGKNENQQFPGNPPNIENLFGTNTSGTPWHLQIAYEAQGNIVPFGENLIS